MTKADVAVVPIQGGNVGIHRALENSSQGYENEANM